MTEAERLLVLRISRRAASLAPDTAKALFMAWREIRESLSDAEVAKLIASGRVDQILDDAVLDKAFLPLKERLREAITRSFAAEAKALPRTAQTAVAFDLLNPDTVLAVRRLESRVIVELQDDIKDTVRAHVENGLRDGQSTAAIARTLRPIIGLSPTQAENAQKYRANLEEAGALNAAQIDKAVAAYARKAIALTANTNAQTAVRDSLKLGQQLSWQDAIEKGVVSASDVERIWVTVGDDRVRPEHQAMNGQMATFDGVFPNGEYIPGESTYNCRCIVRYRVTANRQQIAA